MTACGGMSIGDKGSPKTARKQPLGLDLRFVKWGSDEILSFESTL